MTRGNLALLSVLTLIIVGCSDSGASLASGACPSSETSDARYEAQLRKYDEQASRADAQLSRAEKQAERMEALLLKWEQQAKRYDALLGVWEKQQQTGRK